MFKIKPRAPSLLLPFGVKKNQEIEVELVELPPCDQLIRYLWTGVPNPVSGHVWKMGWWYRKKSKKVYLQTSTLHSYVKKKIILLLSLLSQTSGWRWGGGVAVGLLKFIFEGSPVARRSLDMSPTLDLTDSPPGAITAACIAKYGCSRFNFPEPVNLDLSPSSLSHFKRLPLWLIRDCWMRLRRTD